MAASLCARWGDDVESSKRAPIPHALQMACVFIGMRQGFPFTPNETFGLAGSKISIGRLTKLPLGLKLKAQSAL
jgi:hypothetical protein